MSAPAVRVPLGGIRSAVRAWAAPWWREAVPFAAITTIGLALRVVDLASKPMHHDESLLEGHGYAYDPVYHGPVQIYLTALAHLVLGAGETAARMAPALAGTVLVFLPFFLRRQLGTVATLTASTLLCVSPSFLYFSRFAREDVYVAAVTLGLVVVFLRFLDRPDRRHPSLLLGLLAVSFATKETTYIFVVLAGLFLAALVLAQRRAVGSFAETGLVRAVASVGAAAWAWGVSVFLLVYTLLFSTFLTNPDGVREGLWGSIDYWLSQQEVARGGQPWFYYLVLVPAYEWPIVLLGLLGAVVALRRRTVAGVLLVWLFAGSLVVYSWASERMPWLVLHPLLPLVLLAGIGADALWRARRKAAARVAATLAAVAAVAATVAAVRVAYVEPTDPRELLVQVQSAEDVPGIRDELLRLEAAGASSMLVDSWGGTGWPWTWYLRDAPVGYYDMSRPGDVPSAPILLVADPNRETMAPRLDGYVPRQFRLRVWWVPDWGGASPRDWLRWAVTRKAWSPTATMDEWLYVRPELAQRLSRTEPAGEPGTDGS